jgi:hypothetical protein
MDWIDLARDRDRDRESVVVREEASGSIKCGIFLD